MRSVTPACPGAAAAAGVAAAAASRRSAIFVSYNAREAERGRRLTDRPAHCPFAMTSLPACVRAL